MNNLIAYSLAGTALAAGISLAPFFSSFAKDDLVETASSSIIDDLTRIVEIRSELVEGQKLLAGGGRASLIAELEAKIALCEAEFKLARELKETDQCASKLNEIVSLHEEAVAALEARSVGRQSAVDIRKIRIGFLEARIRLARFEASHGR